MTCKFHTLPNISNFCRITGEQYIPNAQNLLHQMSGSKNFGRGEFKVMENCINGFWGQFCNSASRLSQLTGNIYTGSLYLNLVSYLVHNTDLKDKRVLMFSYGSGAMSSLFCLRVRENNN